MFFILPKQKTAQLFCASGMNRLPAWILWRGFYLLCWVKHMSAGRLVTCFAAHVCTKIFFFILFFLSGLFLFADGTRFTCNCAQVQQKSPCSPMFFARLLSNLWTSLPACALSCSCGPCICFISAGGSRLGKTRQINLRESHYFLSSAPRT